MSWEERDQWCQQSDRSIASIGCCWANVACTRPFSEFPAMLFCSTLKCTHCHRQVCPFWLDSLSMSFAMLPTPCSSSAIDRVYSCRRLLCIWTHPCLKCIWKINWNLLLNDIVPFAKIKSVLNWADTNFSKLIAWFGWLDSSAIISRLVSASSTPNNSKSFAHSADKSLCMMSLSLKS